MISALVAAWFAARQVPPAQLDSPLVPPAAAAPADAPVQEAAPTGEVVDIFSVRTWEPPPPAPAAPEAAQAPPLPFRFLGRIAEPGKPVVFLLLEGERIFQVRVGDTVGAYRVVKFDGGRLFFRYRPLNMIQTLDVGDLS